MGILQVLKTAVTHPVQSFTTGAKALPKIFFPENKNINSFVVPVSMGSAAPVARAPFAGVKNLATKGWSMAKKEFLGTPKTLGKALGTAAKGAAIATGAVTAGKYAVTGRLEWPSTRTFAELMSIRTSPIATVAGNIEGVSEIAHLGINDLIDRYKQRPIDLGKSQIGIGDTTDALQTQLSWLKSQIPSFSGGLPSPQSTVNISMPGMPNVNTPSTPSFGFSPSVSMGGGGSEILPLLLAMGVLGGLGGYAIGKRKKKKYKKRRKH